MVPGNSQSMSIRFIRRLDARCRARGFTLIELMVTLAVVAILGMLAAPSFRHLIVSSSLSNLSSDLNGDLQFARTEAVSRQMNVAVAASSGAWKNGWTVEAIPASTAGGATAQILRVHAGVPAQYALAAAPAGSVVYIPQGTLKTGSSGACFTLSAPASNNTPVFLQVAPSGMSQQTTGTSTPPSSPTCLAP